MDASQDGEAILRHRRPLQGPEQVGKPLHTRLSRAIVQQLPNVPVLIRMDVERGQFRDDRLVVRARIVVLFFREHGVPIGVHVDKHLLKLSNLKLHRQPLLRRQDIIVLLRAIEGVVADHGDDEVEQGQGHHHDRCNKERHHDSRLLHQRSAHGAPAVQGDNLEECEHRLGHVAEVFLSQLVILEDRGLPDEVHREDGEDVQHDGNDHVGVDQHAHAVQNTLHQRPKDLEHREHPNHPDQANQPQDAEHRERADNLGVDTHGPECPLRHDACADDQE
mmetsp:Transcript_3639/g.13344  ORF Transcript_3639/g.13344 Transcript_3639/m.13344 type:complete len:277 (+) Transcript_3639:346-1176(+)